MGHRKICGVVLFISIFVCSLFGAELNFEKLNSIDHLIFNYSSDYLDVDVLAMSHYGHVELSDSDGFMKLCISPKNPRAWIGCKDDFHSLSMIGANVHVLIESLDYGIEFDGIWKEEAGLGEYVDISDDIVPYLIMMLESSDSVYVELTGDKITWGGPYKEFLYLDNSFVKHVMRDVYHRKLVITNEDLLEAKSLNIELENHVYDSIYENGYWSILGKNNEVCAYLGASSKEGYDCFVIGDDRKGYLRFNKHPLGEDIIIQDGYISKSDLASIVKSMDNYWEAEIVYMDGTQEIRIPVDLPNISEVDGFTYQIYQMLGDDKSKLY